MTPEPAWRKSSYCGSNACVQVAHTGDSYLMRDSKNPHAEPLAFTTAEWDTFIRGIQAGDFNQE